MRHIHIKRLSEPDVLVPLAVTDDAWTHLAALLRDQVREDRVVTVNTDFEHYVSAMTPRGRVLLTLQVCAKSCLDSPMPRS